MPQTGNYRNAGNCRIGAAIARAYDQEVKLSRRQALAAIGGGSVSLLLAELARAYPAALLVSEQTAAAVTALPTPPGARFIRTMPLGRLDRRPAPPYHQLLGSGLDARLFTDLSGLDADHLVTPTERFYIRSAAAPALPAAASWQLTLGGLVREERTLTAEALRRDSDARGVHLMECAGNADPANFGLLSAATWSGVPIAAVLDRVQPSGGRRRIRVVGFDDEQTPSQTSTPGASWIFTRDELEQAGAFLATAMNGQPLTRDHGAPVRLLVPNYYGCSNIKWVTRIDVVADDEPATLQMQEFSARTHQDGRPRVARDYAPPVIELAATPTRVEQWMEPDGRGGERPLYRIVGLRWGGSTKRTPLTIRFKHSEPFVPVEHAPDRDSVTTWALWSHTWRPDSPGRYQVALSVADKAIRARRLDIFYYTRDVEIA